MAATDEITRLMRNIRVEVPGALDDVIKLKLFDAVSDFMDRSLVAYEEDTFTTVADQLEYDVSVTGPYQITRLLSLADADGYEVGATMDVPGTVKLTSPPSGGKRVSGWLSLETWLSLYRRAVFSASRVFPVP